MSQQSGRRCPRRDHVSSLIALLPAAAAAPECRYKIGSAEQGGQPWEQRRLGMDEVWPIADGRGVLVGVVDSGFDATNPQLAGIKTVHGVNVSGVNGPTNTQDCV